MEIKPTAYHYSHGRKVISKSNVTCEDLYYRLKRQKLIYAFQAEFAERKADFGNDFWIHRETIVRNILMELLGLTFAESSKIHKQTVTALLEQINGGPFAKLANFEVVPTS